MAFADTGSAHNSPASFINQESLPVGQSLFAELEELVVPVLKESMAHLRSPYTLFRNRQPLFTRACLSSLKLLKYRSYFDQSWWIHL